MIYETRVNLRNKTKEDLILLVNEGLQTIQRYEAELNKKNEIINLMALAILNYDDQLTINRYKNLNEVKQTFEKYLKDNATDTNVGTIGEKYE